MSKQLGPYFVPLHLNSDFEGEPISPKDKAAVAYRHWRSMIDRSKGHGFRLAPGVGSKRKHPRNPRHGAVEMILNGLLVTARYSEPKRHDPAQQPV